MLKPGDVRFYRDKWGVPASVTVDYQCGPMVRGLSNRGSFVIIGVDRLVKTIAELG